MPELPPSYEGTQNDDQMRSVDTVPIEPSIKEGTFLIASTYGPGASAPLDRYPPSVLVDPYISGDHRIPNWLTVHDGAWDGSPYPKFEYQWTSDGVDIPGATGKQWLSDLAYENTVIRCRVRGYSRFGEVTVTSSNSISIERIEAVNVMEEDFSLVSGLGAELAQTVQNFRLSYLTGLGAETAQTMLDKQIYYLTGRAADGRLDTNDMKLMYLQGLPAEQRLMNLVSDVAVINTTPATPLVSGMPQPLKILNPGAELGVLGWTLNGSLTTSSGNPAAYEGNRYFYGGNNGSTLTTAHQDLEFAPEHYADIDAGNTFMEGHWRQRSRNGIDQVNVYLEFFDGSGTSIGLYDGPGLWAAPSVIWFHRYFQHAPIPVGARSVRLTMEFFNANGATNANNEGMLDDLQAFIRKDGVLDPRDFGPDFSYLRVRFTEAGTYSGVALNELEFGDAPSGGTDLATGGVALSGSEGLGTSADNAFSDDLSAGNFWAGAEGAVDRDSAWIGYNFPAAVTPNSLTIHARRGPTANQMGTVWYLEGSDDGQRWTKIQRFADYNVWGNEESRIYEVFRTTQFFGISVPETVGHSTGNATKGNVFLMDGRMNITNVRIQYTDGGTSGKILIAKLEPEVDAIQEVLYESGTVTSSGPGPVVTALTQSVPVEVDDRILIAFVRTDGTGTTSAGINQVSGGAEGFSMDLARFAKTWSKDLTNPSIGTIPLSTSTNQLFAIDFQAEVF